MANKEMIDAKEDKVVAVHKAYKITLEGTAGLIMNKMPDLSLSKAEKKNQARVDLVECERLHWREKAYTENGMVVIPGENIHECMKEAAKYWGGRIDGEGKRTYTDLIASAVICDSVQTGINENDERELIPFGKAVNGNPSKGKKSGCKVYRIRPLLPIGWRGTFVMHVFDSRITNHVLNTIFEFGGTFKGLCDWRPTYGRFSVVSMEEM